MAVLEWLRNNVEIISVLLSACMLVIWLFYLNLFYRSYRRQRRPNLLIHQSGFALDSWCLIANMSESTVHIVAILVDAEYDQGSCTWQPMDPRGLSADVDHPFQYLKQGPMGTGDYLTLGSYRQLLEEAAYYITGGGEIESLGVEVTLRVRVIAFVGSQLIPMGATRSFRVRQIGEDAEVRPVNIFPKQLSSGRNRRLARRWLEEAENLDRAAVIVPPSIRRGEAERRQDR